MKHNTNTCDPTTKILKVDLTYCIELSVCPPEPQR